MKKNLYRGALAIVALAWVYTLGGFLAMAALILATAAYLAYRGHRHRRAATAHALKVEAPLAAAELVVAYALGVRRLSAQLQRGTIVTTIVPPPEYTAPDVSYTRAVTMIARSVLASSRGGDDDAIRAAEAHLGDIVRGGVPPTGHTIPGDSYRASVRELRKQVGAFAKSILDDAAPIHDELTAELRATHRVDETTIDVISHRNPLEEPSIGGTRHA